MVVSLGHSKCTPDGDGNASAPLAAFLCVGV